MVPKRNKKYLKENIDGFYFLKKEADELIEKYSQKKKKSIYFEKYGIPFIIFILILILILKYILYAI
jgi:hypothetical protein